MKAHMLLVVIFLSSCSLLSRDPTVIDRPKLNLNIDSSIDLNDVQFKVITESTSQEYFRDNSAAFALTEIQYKNLALNIEEIKYFIRKQLKIIRLYKNYYEEVDKTDLKK
jgi:hypothetical protein